MVIEEGHGSLPQYQKPVAALQKESSYSLADLSSSAGGNVSDRRLKRPAIPTSLRTSIDLPFVEIVLSTKFWIKEMAIYDRDTSRKTILLQTARWRKLWAPTSSGRRRRASLTPPTCRHPSVRKDCGVTGDRRIIYKFAGKIKCVFPDRQFIASALFEYRPAAWDIVTVERAVSGIGSTPFPAGRIMP
ncbi:hypothetical protein [Rhizobium leguminosarum]|uniref:hypothetical protein n=1 Tax=Rhizobium leguminosarum TaxID=384 RepID=UPI0011AEA4BE|nr:hypothetical protein [Rhizobium leguminosarum]